MARKRKTPLGSEAASAPPLPPVAASNTVEVEPAFTLARSEEAPGQLVLTLVLPGVEGAHSSPSRALFCVCVPVSCPSLGLSLSLSLSQTLLS